MSQVFFYTLLRRYIKRFTIPLYLGMERLLHSNGIDAMRKIEKRKFGRSSLPFVRRKGHGEKISTRGKNYFGRKYGTIFCGNENEDSAWSPYLEVKTLVDVIVGTEKGRARKGPKAGHSCIALDEVQDPVR